MQNIEFRTGKNNENLHEVWSEYVNGHTYYFERVNGISSQISKRRFDNLQKKVAFLYS